MAGDVLALRARQQRDRGDVDAAHAARAVHGVNTDKCRRSDRQIEPDGCRVRVERRAREDDLIGERHERFAARRSRSA